MNQPHTSVLLNEVLNIFSSKGLKIFVDATLGAGGHSLEILNAHPELQHLVGFDQDPYARAIAKERLCNHASKLTIIAKNFSTLTASLLESGIGQVDGILADIGVSSMQVDIAERGFSFAKDGPLDMRMDPESSLTAALIINTWDEREIGRIFRVYGEEERWRQAAYAIVTSRSQMTYRTTKELVNLLYPVLQKKGPREKQRHPLTKVFQALRIAVNRELEVLENFLPQALKALNPGGRLAIISFHSLEDRSVKECFREWASDKVAGSGQGGIFLDKDPLVKIITNKPIIPSPEEIMANPRARSAKLRCVEKL